MKKYIRRTIENEIKQGLKEFPVLIITGARQTGKSTMLLNMFSDYNYITLDEPFMRSLAVNDPEQFLSNCEEKSVIDEIQYAPELLKYIKIQVDKNRRNGRYILTGSQYFPIMANVTESLAGRACIYELYGLSIDELKIRKMNLDSLFKLLIRGFYPETAVHNANPQRFYASYIMTYLERDVRSIMNVQDLKVFQDFIQLLAARAGSLLNLNEISKECGISITTAKKWLSILESTGIVYLLKPYFKNISKRVIKNHKLYFCDTGLLLFLLKYKDAEQLLSSSVFGNVFENFIVIECLKHKHNYSTLYELYFYRDSHHNEIDLILEYSNSFKCIEIKCASTPKNEHLKSLQNNMHLFKNAVGYLVSNTAKKIQVSKQLTIINWKEISEILGK